MNLLKNYADQVKSISEGMRSGELSMEKGAVRLRSLALLVEQDAASIDDAEYRGRLNKMADMIYAVVEKMDPQRRVVQ